MNETKQRIIQSAEIEFAEHGFQGASIRDITKRAEVNIAAINYHFGSKEELFKEMMRFHVEPLNRIRIDALREAQKEANGQALPLEQVIDIIVRPALTSLIKDEGGQYHFMRAVGRGMAEEQDFMRDLHEDILKEPIQIFSKAISESLGIPDFKRITYGMHFLTCSMAGTMMQHAKLQSMSKGQIDLGNVDELADYLVAYISGGLRAVANL